MSEVEDRRAAIDLITLPDVSGPAQPAALSPEAVSPEPPDAGTDVTTDTAQIDAGALIALDRALSAQDKADISNSLLFAQLAANAKQNRFTAPMQWIQEYTTVLGALGWVAQLTRTSSPVRVDPPVDWAGVVSRAFPPNAGGALAAKAFAAADRLAAGSAGLAIWTKNAATALTGNFQVQSFSAAGGDVAGGSVQVAFSLNTDASGFLTWNSYYEITTSSATMVLNEEVYAQVRQIVIDKLGDRPKTYITPVPL